MEMREIKFDDLESEAGRIIIPWQIFLLDPSNLETELTRIETLRHKASKRLLAKRKGTGSITSKRILDRLIRCQTYISIYLDQAVAGSYQEGEKAMSGFFRMIPLAIGLCLSICAPVGLTIFAAPAQAEQLCQQACNAWCDDNKNTQTCYADCAARPLCQKVSGKRLVGGACYGWCKQHKPGSKECTVDCDNRR
jgi:hypothetical protein